MAKSKIQKSEKVIEEMKAVEVTFKTESMARSVEFIYRKEAQTVAIKNMDNIDYRELSAEYLDIYIAIITHARNLLK